MAATIGLIDGLWIGVLTHLWQTTIVLAVLAALSLAMRRAPARLLNALWWIGLVKLIVPLQLVAPALRRVIDPVGVRAHKTGAWFDGITVWLSKADSLLDPAESGLRARLAGLASGEAWAAALLALWCLGAVWLLILVARARSAAVDCIPPDELEDELRDRVDAALGGTRIPRRSVRVAATPVMPATLGVLRRRIVVPRVLVERLTAPELRAILLHEEAHRRRFEPLQIAVQRAAAVAFYFFPPLWPLLSRLRETSEIACDEAAVREGVSRSDFARALARTLSIGLEPCGLAAGFARGAPSMTRRRLKRLSDEGRFVSMRRYWLCLALAAVAVVVVSTSTLVSFATDAEAVDESAEKAPAKEVDWEADETWFSITAAHHVDPEYPEDARKDGVGGRVLLRLTINPKSGEVVDVVVTEDVEGYPSLADAAVLAIGQWTFNVEGDPAGDVMIMVPVDFALDGPNTKKLSIKIPDAKGKPAQPGDPAQPAHPDAPADAAEPVEPEDAPDDSAVPAEGAEPGAPAGQDEAPEPDAP